MRFLSEEQARNWAGRFAAPDNPRGLPHVPAPDHEASVRSSFEDLPGYKYFGVAQDVVRALHYFDEALLWVTQTGVWPSNENLHIYYRLRESYGDRLLVGERPAVLALRHEVIDLTSFVHLGMLFGWDMYLVASHDYGRVFISHDGWLQLSESTPDVVSSFNVTRSA